MSLAERSGFSRQNARKLPQGSGAQPTWQAQGVAISLKSSGGHGPVGDCLKPRADPRAEPSGAEYFSREADEVLRRDLDALSNQVDHRVGDFLRSNLVDWARSSGLLGSDEAVPYGRSESLRPDELTERILPA